MAQLDIDPNAVEPDRIRRNWQRLIKGFATSTVALSTNGGLQYTTGQLGVKLNGTSLLLGASGLSINTAGVTLAMMANLATDTLIGRQTAGTGVPEAVTCTAAGRALIDDANAGAQLTTLGITRGTATLSGASGTVTVNTAAVTANSLIFLTVTNGGTTYAGRLRVSARTPATSFVITSSGGATDDVPVSWMLFEP